MLGMRRIKIMLKTRYFVRFLHSFTPEDYLRNENEISGTPIELVSFRLSEICDEDDQKTRVNLMRLIELMLVAPLKDSLNDSRNRRERVDCYFVLLADESL